jgi:SAM-dependent methyltransferase
MSTLAHNTSTEALNEASYDQRLRDLEARMADVQTALAASQPAGPKASVANALATVDTILAELTKRLLTLEGQYLVLKNAVAAETQRVQDFNPQWIDRTVKELSQRVCDANPNFSFINQRFRDFELALRDIRNLAAFRDSEYCKQHPLAKASGPAFHPLKAKACTESDIRSPWVAFWTRELQMGVNYHRKCWELCYVPQILYNEGKLREGTRGLGFACGEEPLPSLFAKYGVEVVATDLEPARAEAQGWVKTNQHLSSFAKLRRRDICPDESRLEKIEGRYLDMNAIPADLHGQFDFCWSVCSLEHLGSIANGLNFIENSMLTLKPGGVSVHTLEFNINDGDTVDNWPTVLFQKSNLLDVAERLKAKGFSVYDFDFDTGQGILDGFVDLPPFFEQQYPLHNSHAHLKLSIDGFVCTSFGFIAKKPEA